MHNMNIAKLNAALAQGTFSSEEITSSLLTRIQKHDKILNSFITITADTAISAAIAADKQRSAQGHTPMLGVPIAHKDIFCTRNTKTSCGSKMLDNFIAPYDATVVTQFNQAGAVVIGKTNMDEFAMGSSNETSYYGPVHNPWDPNRVPGGSSGGSAAAVAARFVPGATGTDTGGSIRQPAALCGITGLKPTYGRVSRYGMVAFASSLDQGGPMAQSAEDCALMLQVMAGFDPKDSTSLNVEVPNYSADLNASIKGLKIGLPKEFFKQGLDPDIEKVTTAAIKVFEGLGASVIDVDLPHSPLSIPVYYVLASAECSSNLSRYDGVRFGYRCDAPKDLEDLYKRTRGEGFGSEVKRRIMMGTYALSAGYYDAYYGKAQCVRRLISEDFNQAFKQVDVLLGPSSPSTAFTIGEKANDPISLYLQDIFTNAVNLAGLPAISIPAGFADGLPVGVQLIGDHLQETRLLNAAHQFQQQTDWHQQQPVEMD